MPPSKAIQEKKKLLAGVKCSKELLTCNTLNRIGVYRSTVNAPGGRGGTLNAPRSAGLQTQEQAADSDGNVLCCGPWPQEACSCLF